MNRNCFGAVVGLCLALAAMGLAKMSVWRQAGTISPEIAQLDAKYKDRCPYYPSPVLCYSRTMMGRASDEGRDFESTPDHRRLGDAAHTASGRSRGSGAWQLERVN
jgi:hypothetical protein